MDIFEYLPQLIVAYDGDDEFANLIHVKKANKEKDYLCPCCGGIVKPRALDSNKEQSHYYHKTGKCTKESQLHFFCKNWLFEEGSKFYIGNELFEVEAIDIEKAHFTSFGDYKPDITVYTTSSKTIFFEMFFTNRKTGDDYFCKWDELKNDVVEVNIKEYMFKTDATTIPSFTYLYHESVCYSKPYIKRDLYANTIAKIKRELTRQKVLNYKARIEQLDWFWQEIRNNTKESILDIVSKMDYDDMISCYEIIKRKQCVSYLKNDILNMINQKTVSDIRKTLDLPYDENVYFDLKHIRGRTYEAGIRLNIKTDHIAYNDIYYHCICWDFDKTNTYPKIVFSKNIFNQKEINIPCNKIKELQNIFGRTVEYKKELLAYENDIANFEGQNYKIRVNNNLYTVIEKTQGEDFKIILDNCYIGEFDTDVLAKEIQNGLYKIECKNFISRSDVIESVNSIVNNVQNYNDLKCIVDIKYENEKYDISQGIHLSALVNKKCVYDKLLQPNYDDLNEKINECKDVVNYFCEKYSMIFSAVEQINECKNKFWEANCSFDYYDDELIKIEIHPRISPNDILPCRRIILHNIEDLDVNSLMLKITDNMRLLLKDLENYDIRVMEECYE